MPDTGNYVALCFVTNSVSIVPHAYWPHPTVTQVEHTKYEGYSMRLVQLVATKQQKLYIFNFLPLHGNAMANWVVFKDGLYCSPLHYSYSTDCAPITRNKCYRVTPNRSKCGEPNYIFDTRPMKINVYVNAVVITEIPVSLVEPNTLNWNN